MPPDPILDVADLRAGYGATPVLQGVDLSVGRGEVVALVGRNGVGKTTTMRCLIGLVRTTAGSIRFAGEGLTRAAADARARRGIGYILQGRDVFPRMTCRRTSRLES